MKRYFQPELNIFLYKMKIRDENVNDVPHAQIIIVRKLNKN